MRTQLIILAVSMHISACLDAPNFMGKSSRGTFTHAKIGSSSTEIKAVTIEKASGVVAAKISSDSKVTQVIEASGKLAGNGIALAPGSLAGFGDTQVTVEPGSNIADENIIADLGLTEVKEVTPASTPMVVTTDKKLDPVKPISLTMSLAISSAGLNLNEDDTLERVAIAFQRINYAAGGITEVGLILRKNLTVENGKVKFDILKFGLYQVIITDVVVEKEPEVVETEAEIVTEREALALPEVTSTKPVATFDNTTRSLTVASTYSGATISTCKVLIFDSNSVLTQNATASDPESASIAIKTTQAATYTAKLNCLDEHGRWNKSVASNSVEIAALTTTLSGAPSASSGTKVLSVGVSGNGVSDYVYYIEQTSSTTCVIDKAISKKSTDEKITDSVSDGTNLLCVFGIDASGNVAQTASSTSFYVDATSPTVVSITGTDGTYTLGDTISLSVVFSENVTVTGSPTLALDIAGGSATYVSGSGTKTLAFTYTVQNGDSSNDLDYASQTALSGTIADAYGNAALLTLVTPGSSSSLSGASAIFIDASAPGAPTSFSANSSASQIDLSWVEDSGASGYLIARSTTTMSWTPTPGTSYKAGDTSGSGAIIANATGKTYTDTGLNSGVTYYYAIYAFDASHNYSSAATTGAETHPQPVSNLSLSESTATVDITFTAGSGAHHFLIVRRANAPVTWTPTQGGSYSSGVLDADHELLANTTATTFNDSSVSGATTYYYSVFAATANNTYSGELASSITTSESSGSSSSAFVDIRAGEGHTCGLTGTGKVYCWGLNNYGQLGNGTTTSSTLPVLVDTSGISPYLRFSQIAVGFYNTCALSSEGAVYCWGYDGWGTVGDGGAAVNATTPTPVSTVNMTGTTTFKYIGGSTSYHMCGISTAGEAYCWGENQAGQLGIGSITATTEPTKVNTTSMSGDQTFINIATTRLSTCGIAGDGKVYCWGRNYELQVGDGTATDRNTPTLVNTANVSNPTFKKLTGAYFTNCGITGDGKAYCWGHAGDGNYGNGSTANSGIPQEVDTTGFADPGIIDVAASANATCFLTSDGNVYCTGTDSSGQLGNGDASTANQYVGAPIDTSLVTGSQKFISISAGWVHHCGLTADGAAYCWGNNGYGQAGVGTTTNISKPTPVDASAIAEPMAVKQIKLSDLTSCALNQKSKMYCWGYGYEGGLGYGGSTDQHSPVPVDTSSFAANEPTFRNMSEGYRTQCAIATDGKAWCFGHGTYGQLGNNTTTTYQYTPELVNTSSMTNTTPHFIDIAGGVYQTCAIAADGKVFCWGNASFGGIGNNSFSGIYSTPQPIDEASFGAETSTFKKLASRYYTTCGISTAGKLWCWGYNVYGELGIGLTGTNYATPQLVASPNNETFIDISAGIYSFCALSSAGNAYCWGYNGNGELGVGSYTNYSTPQSIVTQAITGETVFHDITRSGYATFASTSSGDIWVWGYNGNYDFGDGSTVSQNMPMSKVNLTYNSSPPEFKELSSGVHHSCGLTTTGEVWCWGYNAYGQLGNASTITGTLPTAVSSGFEN